MAKEISVIIPSRNEIKNLMWTLQSAQAELEGRDYELIPVLNMHSDEDAEKLEKYWPFQQGKGQVVRYDKPSCWQSRNAGAAVATGKYLLFLDSHVLFAPGSLERLLDFKVGWTGVAHCALQYWLEAENRTLYGYIWKPEKFWGNWTRTKPEPPDYRVPMSGTSSSLIERELFEEIRPIHPELGIYGGGETYLDFKVQMFGGDVRMPPGCKLWHLTEKRGYNWNKRDFQRNFMLSAYALGGEKYLDILYKAQFEDCKGIEKYEVALAILREEAIAAAQADRDFVEANAKLTLDEVIASWN